MITPMTLEDLPWVEEIERASFSAPWSFETFRHELVANPRSFYWVVRPHPEPTSETRPPILCYGGYWLMGEEVHIVILATHLQWRRCGLAEWLLLEMLAIVHELDAHEITLEVRAGNIAARQLYHKLGFEEVGLRKRYYRDNGEDAILLTLFNLHEWAVWQPLRQRLLEVRERSILLQFPQSERSAT